MFDKHNLVVVRGLMAGLLAFSLFLSGPARAEDRVSLDFVNTDIAAVAKAVGYITQRNFIMDPRIKGTINIVSARPVPKSQVYDVFLSALRTQGYTVVEGRGAYKIVPEADAKMNYTLTAGKQLRRGDDALVTQVYPLQFADAAQMLPVLRPLISPNNVVSALTVGNMLVITDYADNLKRLDRLIEAMDQPAGHDSAVIQLKYAVAGDVISVLQKLLGEAKDEPLTQRVSMAADARTNTLLVRSDNPSKLERVRQIVAELDNPAAQAAAPKVIYLRNADAASLVQTLRGGLSAGSSSSSSLNSGSISSSGGSESSTAGLSSSSMSSGAAPTAQGGSASLANGQLQILADTSANAIILVGPAVLQAQYEQVIDKLDTRPAEVFIEALIVEMNADKAQELGIQWQFLSGLGKSSTSVIGGTNFGSTGTNILSASQNLAGVGQGINLGVMDGTVTVPIAGTDVKILNLGMLAHALEAQSGTHILSAPNLLTLDNEEAQIVVGQNVPFVTGQYTVSSTSSSTSPFQTIERQDVGLKLKVKPQIAEDGSIRLKLYQEVSSIQSTSDVNGPTTNKRSIDTSVVVDDKHIVVLGGLMQDTFENSLDKVPLLGDIPVVGHLFRSKTRSQVKTDLFVFLRPVVVRDRQGLDALSGARYDYARGRFGGDVDRSGMKLEAPAGSQLWLQPDESRREQAAGGKPNP
jgi:general secretion pathway protein D